MRIKIGRRGYKKIVIRDEKGNISNFQALAVAVSGHGKSVAVERLIDICYRNNYNIFVITQKDRVPNEIAFNGLPPIGKYSNLLKMQGTKESIKNIKLYHPITDKILEKELPNLYNLFSIPIKSLEEDEKIILSENFTDGEDYKLLDEAINKLNPKQGLYDLFHIMDNLTEKEIKSKSVEDNIVKDRSNEENFFISDEGINSSRRNLSSLRRKFSCFLRDWCLHAEDSPFKLDFKDMVKTKALHILDCSWVKSSKLKYLITVWFVNQVLACKRDSPYSFLFVIQEAKSFFPVASKEKFVDYASFVFMKILSQIRSLGCSSILDTQNIYELRPEVREAVTVEIYGRLSNQDINNLAKIQGFTKRLRQELSGLKEGKFIIKGDNEFIIFKSLIAGCAHNEEGQEWKSFYKKIFPENYFLLEDKFKLLNELRTKERDIAQQRAKALTDKEIKRKQEIIERKKKKKMEKVITQIALDTTKEFSGRKQIFKEDFEKKVLLLHNEGISNVQVGFKLGCSESKIRTVLKKLKYIENSVREKLENVEK